MALIDIFKSHDRSFAVFGSAVFVRDWGSARVGKAKCAHGLSGLNQWKLVGTLRFARPTTGLCCLS